jgi:hypothetical protein
MCCDLLVNTVCDRCRLRDFDGVRYKCANCKDYDLCAICEGKTYLESLGLSPRTGVTFACPYSLQTGCQIVGLNELDLRDHIMAQHEKALELVRCPICEVNGTQAVFMQPRFGEHLRTAHCDEHDVTRHTLIKISRMIPHFHSRRFEMLPPFKLATDTTSTTSPSSLTSTSSSSSSSSTATAVVSPTAAAPRSPTLSPAIGSPSSPATATTATTATTTATTQSPPENKDDRGPCDRVWATADTRQHSVIHHGTSCSHCRQSPIMYTIIARSSSILCYL